jgi:hypothetical protein
LGDSLALARLNASVCAISQNTHKTCLDSDNDWCDYHLRIINTLSNDLIAMSAKLCRQRIVAHIFMRNAVPCMHYPALCMHWFYPSTIMNLVNRVLAIGFHALARAASPLGVAQSLSQASPTSSIHRRALIGLSEGVTMKNPLAWAPVCALGLAAVLTIASPAVVAFAQAAPVTYNSTSGLATQYVDSQGHTVIVLQGIGDLPGVLTLVLTVASDGTVSGEWAMNVSYSAPLHPDAQPDPTATDADGAQGDQLIQKGMLKGKIVNGSATMANGQITALTSLQLNIVAGSIQFAGVTTGSGAVNATHLDDRTTSTAYVSLTF